MDYELWASHEVCAALGWQRKQLKTARERRGFPEPLGVVAGALRVAVWDAADVMAWAMTDANPKRRQELKRAHAVRVYRRTGSIAEACRAVGSRPDSVRKWIRDAGELTPTERRDAIAEAAR